MNRSTHPYGSHPSQVGELFLPSGERPHPVCVVVHGGYWRAQYDRSLMTGVCDDLAAHGVAAWNVEYRRVGSGGGWPETFLDVAAGIDALAELDAPIDLSVVLAVGHSAGDSSPSGQRHVRPCRTACRVRRRVSRSRQPSRRPACSISPSPQG